jgi:hypothetical protein
MKTIIENTTKLSKYLLDDDTPVAFINGQIHVGDPDNLKFIIGDLSDANASMIENVPVTTEGTELTVVYAGKFKAPDIEDTWIGNKFLYDGGWIANPDYVEPEKEEAA